MSRKLQPFNKVQKAVFVEGIGLIREEKRRFVAGIGPSDGTCLTFEEQISVFHEQIEGSYGTFEGSDGSFY